MRRLALLSVLATLAAVPAGRAEAARLTSTFTVATVTSTAQQTDGRYIVYSQRGPVIAIRDTHRHATMHVPLPEECRYTDPVMGTALLFYLCPDPARGFAEDGLIYAIASHRWITLPRQALGICNADHATCSVAEVGADWVSWNAGLFGDTEDGQGYEVFYNYRNGDRHSFGVETEGELIGTYWLDTPRLVPDDSAPCSPIPSSDSWDSVGHGLVAYTPSSQVDQDDDTGPLYLGRCGSRRRLELSGHIDTEESEYPLVLWRNYHSDNVIEVYDVVTRHRYEVRLRGASYPILWAMFGRLVLGWNDSLPNHVFATTLPRGL